jgi:hypothetical protein
MKVSDWIARQIARSLVVLLLVLCADAGMGQEQQATSPSMPEHPNSSAEGGRQQSSDQTGIQDTTESRSSTAYPNAPESQSNGQTGNSQSGAAQEPGSDAKPLGTAAAPYSKPSGVMGSRPAGVVIAPARQRRVRAILISVGVVAGAAIAIGTVAALSHGSPSHP